MAAAAFKFRMNAGSAGDVNRSHPASIVPHMNDTTSPVPFYGAACMFNGSANDVRAITTTDASDSVALTIAGFAVRPYPFQTRSGDDSAAFGASTPQAGAIDVITEGYVMVPTVGTPNLGDPVYIWCDVSTGSHVQGGAEAGATSTDTVLLNGARFNGPPDANGLCEVVITVP